MYKYLRCGGQRDLAKFFSVVCGDSTRSNGHKIEHRKLVMEHWDRTAQGGCGVSFSGRRRIQGPFACLPGQAALRNLLCLWLDSMIFRGPFQPLQFCESVSMALLFFLIYLFFLFIFSSINTPDKAALTHI